MTTETIRVPLKPRVYPAFLGIFYAAHRRTGHRTIDGFSWQDVSTWKAIGASHKSLSTIEDAVFLDCLHPKNRRKLAIALKGHESLASFFASLPGREVFDLLDRVPRDGWYFFRRAVP